MFRSQHSVLSLVVFFLFCLLLSFCFPVCVYGLFWIFPGSWNTNNSIICHMKEPSPNPIIVVIKHNNSRRLMHETFLMDWPNCVFLLDPVWRIHFSFFVFQSVFNKTAKLDINEIILLSGSWEFGLIEYYRKNCWICQMINSKVIENVIK